MNYCTAFILSAILFTSMTAEAQEVRFSDAYSVDVGSPYPVFDGIKRYFAVEGAVIAIKNEEGLWSLQRLNAKTLNEEYVNQYRDMDATMLVEHVGFFGGRLFVFCSQWDRANEREQLFYREVNTTTAAFVGKPEKLMAVSGKVERTSRSDDSFWTASYGRFNPRDKFGFAFSPDDDYMVVHYDRKRDRETEKKNNDMSVAVFGRDMKLLWKDNLKLPYGKNEAAVKDLTVDATGILTMVMSANKKGKAGEEDEEDRAYELLRWGPTSKDWEVLPLAIPDKQLLSLSLFQDAKGVQRAAGFYRANKLQKGADGVYVCAVSNTGAVSDLRFHEIPGELMNMYAYKHEVKAAAKRTAKSGDDSMLWLEMVDIQVGRDGELLLIGEQRFWVKECSTGSQGQMSCFTFWHANNLLVSSISANGALKWMQMIPKRQFSSAPISTTYTHLLAHGQHHFIRFEHAADLQLKAGQVPSGRGDVLVVADRLDAATGAWTREAIMDPDEAEGRKLYQLEQRRMVRAGETQVMMEAYLKGKEDVVVLIKAVK